MTARALVITLAVVCVVAFLATRTGPRTTAHTRALRAANQEKSAWKR